MRKGAASAKDRRPPLPDRPGLKMAVQAARILTHILLVLGFFGMMAGLNSSSREGIIVTVVSVGGFFLSYFTWVGLVLFGYMNFPLSRMLLFVLVLGAAIGMLMSGEEGLMLGGGILLFILTVVTVIPVSQYDPTTERPEDKTRPTRKASVRVQ